MKFIRHTLLRIELFWLWFVEGAAEDSSYEIDDLTALLEVHARQALIRAELEKP